MFMIQPKSENCKHLCIILIEMEISEQFEAQNLIDEDEDVDWTLFELLLSEIVVDEDLQEACPRVGQDDYRDHEDLGIERQLHQDRPLVLDHVRYEAEILRRIRVVHF